MTTNWDFIYKASPVIVAAIYLENQDIEATYSDIASTAVNLAIALDYEITRRKQAEDKKMVQTKIPGLGER